MEVLINTFFIVLSFVWLFLSPFFNPLQIPIYLASVMEFVASPQDYSDIPNQSSTSARTPSPRAFDVVAAYRRALEDDKVGVHLN